MKKTILLASAFCIFIAVDVMGAVRDKIGGLSGEIRRTTACRPSTETVHKLRNYLLSQYELPRMKSAVDIVFKKQASKSKNYPLELLCKYSQIIELLPENPFPLVQAIADGWIYKTVDHSVKKLVVSDGIEMVAQAKESMATVFPDQKPLNELGLECLLSWANRLVFFGGYHHHIGDRYLKRGLMNRSAYRFMVLNPTLLAKSRELLERNNLLDTSQDLRNNLERIESWFWEVLDYTKSATPITVINGVPVRIGVNFSANFQLNSLSRSNTFSGNCFDVGIVETAIYKSIGIPTLFFTYGRMFNNRYYKENHSGGAYYASTDDQWHTDRRGANEIIHWWENDWEQPFEIIFFMEKSPLSSTIRYEAFPLTQIPQDANPNANPSGFTIPLSNKSYPVVVSVKQWVDLNKNGISGDLVRIGLLGKR